MTNAIDMTEFEDEIARVERRELRRVGLILSANGLVLVAALLASSDGTGAIKAFVAIIATLFLLSAIPFLIGAMTVRRLPG